MAATWIGLDGYDASDNPVQFICTTTVMAGNLNVVTQFWFEWCPAGPTPVSNLVGAPGDVITCAIALVPGSDTQVQVSLANKTRGLPVQPFRYSSPLGAPLVGNSADWIVEQNPPTGLAAFQPVIFNGCLASTADGQPVQVSAGTCIAMQDSAAPKAVADFVGPQSVRVTCA
jgi:hypothetical protein